MTETRRRPAWTGEELIACIDGPLSGQWFTAADWRERQAAATHMADRGQRPTAIDSYHPTNHQISHPHELDLNGTAWTSDPDLLTAERERAEEVRVLVTGSRTWERPDDVTAALDQLRADLPAGARLTIVHGANPRGVDAVAAAWATRAQNDGSGRVVCAEAHPADWRSHGRAAGMIRNTAMIRAGADLCLAFIRDQSPGATHCATAARAAGIQTRDWTYAADAASSSMHAAEVTGETVESADEVTELDL